MPRSALLLPLVVALAQPAIALAQTAPVGGPVTPSPPAAPPGHADGENAAAGATASGGNTVTGAAQSPTRNAAGNLPVASTVEPPTPNTNAGTHSVQPTPTPAGLENRATPIIDLHGYLRSRFELFQNYSLGWEQQPIPNLTGAMMPRAMADYNNAHLPWYRSPDFTAQYCGNQPSNGMGNLIVAGSSPGQPFCSNGTQTSANMRVRLDPEIHPTEFIGVYAQIDLLDNLVLGSTPQGYYVGSTRSPWAPLTAFSTTQLPPIFNYNGYLNSIEVKRAWAEVTNQSLGQIRFGRMPSHWGLGILANAGNGYDSDYQTTVDRVMYAARLRPWGIFFAAMWDFVSTGATSQNHVLTEPGQGQPYDLSMWDDVHQWVVALGRRLDPEQARAALARDELVVNGGVYFVYRTQYMSGEAAGTSTASGAGYDPRTQIDACTSAGYGTTCGSQFVRRDAQAFIPDLWLQVLGREFRIELEAVYIGGTIRSFDLTGSSANPGYTVNEFGGALETEYRALNQRLLLSFWAGYASGDPNLNTLSYGSSGLQAPANGAHNLSLFQFHPDYRIDLIFWRGIMQQISGAYYLRPSIGYNFIDEPGGDLFFGRVDLIYSGANEFLQTRGHHRDLGVEIDATLQYQTNHRRPDGTDPRPAPGFYANLQGGVFFPMGGLGPTDAERAGTLSNFSFETAFTLRAYLGVLF